MSPRHKRWAVVLLGLAVAFQVLSFKAITSKTATSHSIGKAGRGTFAGGFDLKYEVVGDAALARAVTSALGKELERIGSVGKALAVAELAPDGEPALRVDVSMQPTESFWTPVYASATVNARIHFSHDGRAPPPPGGFEIIDSSDALLATGEFTIVDDSYGVVSRRGYVNHLAKKLARAIANTTEQSILTKKRS